MLILSQQKYMLVSCRMSEQEDETSLLIKDGPHESNDIKVDLRSSKIGIQRIMNEENQNVKTWNIPKVFVGWLLRLKDSFGAPFMVVVIIVYGVSEGYVGTVRGLATNYYWKDVQKLQPASTQAFQVKYFLLFFLLLLEEMTIATMVYKKGYSIISSISHII